MKYLAFDIGIKNLAYCLFDASQNLVLALENCNLIQDQQIAQAVCATCASKATYQSSLGPACKRHISKAHPIAFESKTIAMKALKEALKAKNLKATGTKVALLERLKEVASVPLIKPKLVKAAEQSLADLHDALLRFCREKWDLFKSSQHVLLENQPAFKNPHMKSVQVLLFAVLREAFVRETHASKESSMPSFHLVHAKKKVVAEAGDEGYKARKQGSEDRLEELFRSGDVRDSGGILEAWSAAKKRSDMSDALCMCVDAARTKLK
jgi:hypothetical protein